MRIKIEVTQTGPTGRFLSLGLSLRQEFDRRVKIGRSDQCWPWLGTIYSTGYGILKHGGVRYGAHRLSYEFNIGKIIDGLCVCHHCDNPECVNPSHLFLGTTRDNQNDSVSKGRHSYGERHPDSKLTEDDIRFIREHYVPGLPIRGKKSEFGCKGLSQRFGVSVATMWAIINRKTWKHV